MGVGGTRLAILFASLLYAACAVSQEPSAPSPAYLDKDAVRSIIADYLKEEEAKKKANPGKAVPLQAKWDNGIWFTSADNQFKIHLGGRMQFESVFWNQPQATEGPIPGNGGIPGSAPNGGFGKLDDATFFRRVRFKADGTAYENVEFNFEINFEQLNLITYDHLWVGMKDIPYLGTVRIGQMKIPQGMEMWGSDYHMTLLERSSLSDAIWTLFGQGIMLANDYFDKNVTFQTMFNRIQPNGFYTGDFGDGDYSSTTRLTWTPYYRDEGASLLHLGGSFQWRHGDLGRTIQPGGTGSTFGDSQSVVRFRARPELRDAGGIGTTFGGSPARFIDTGFLLGDDVNTWSPELLLIQGPFSLQAEGAWAYARGLRSLYPPDKPLTNYGTGMFWGAYGQMSYTLTGEHRGYDRRFAVFDRIKVARPVRIGPAKEGDCCERGWGAWELAYRYSFVDLNDNGVNGGQLGQHGIGLNWYLNDNFKIQFGYQNIQRNVESPAVNGTVHGFGILTQWYF